MRGVVVREQNLENAGVVSFTIRFMSKRLSAFEIHHICDSQSNGICALKWLEEGPSSQQWSGLTCQGHSSEPLFHYS